MQVATAAQTRRLEELAVEHGATWASLMTDAGLGMAAVAQAMLTDILKARVVILVGPGNNGGDGLVIASKFHDEGIEVVIYLWRRKASSTDWPLAQARTRQIAEVEAEHDPSCAHLRELLSSADLVVDALLGTGLSRPLSPELCSIVQAVNEARRPTFAVDIPTGIQSDTGVTMGCGIKATATGVAGIMKPGLLFGVGPISAGIIHVIPIGLPERLEHEHMAETLQAAEMARLLPARPADAHKGTFGKVLVIAGSGRYPGAAFLSSHGALRSGAGLVTLAIGRSIYGALAAASHETTFLPLPEDEWGTLGGDAAPEVRKGMSGYSAIVIGPGIGHEDATKLFIERLLKIEDSKAGTSVGFISIPKHAVRERKQAGSVGFLRSNPAPEASHSATQEQAEAESDSATWVLDADALNILATVEDWHAHITAGSAILTPHPGEMARLLDLDGPAAVNEDRLGTAQRAAREWKQVVVLKGAATVVADPDGRTAIGPAGNPALATAGTGDVLSGVIGGLLAQGLAPYDAARLGVYIHAAAGRSVRDEVGEAGAIAGDLLERIPRTMTDLRKIG